jgi:exosortase D (VPLPA-CTERM-specific)
MVTSNESPPLKSRAVSATRAASQIEHWQTPATVFALLALVLLVAAWPFLPALNWMWSWWVDSPEYSHGILLPPLAAYLIWRRRGRLREIPFSGSWLGLLAVLCAAALYTIGELGSLYVVLHFAYWLLLAGVLLALMGWAAFRLIAGPVTLLLLAIPLPQLLLANLSATLQLWSSQLGVAFMRIFGISVLLQGNVIDLGRYRLEVAEACSGLRYLFPLLALSAIIAYLYRGALWKRLAILLSAVPLTVITNGLRIGTIGVLVDRFGPQLAAGAVHDVQGWAMFMLTGGVLLGELALLHRIGAAPGSWRDALAEPAVPLARIPGIARPARLTPPFVAAALTVLALAVTSELLPPRVQAAPARLAFAEFPDHVAGWSGRRTAISADVLQVMQVDDYLMADYIRSDARPVNLYLAYYASQRKGNAVHSPRACLPGAGWAIEQISQRSVPGITITGRTLIVDRAVVALGEQRALVYYWFQGRGRVLTNEFAMKWLLFWDALARGRSDGSLVRLTTPITPGEPADAADQRLAAFAASVAPMLPQYVPD